jgi:hypothetical protein
VCLDLMRVLDACLLVPCRLVNLRKMIRCGLDIAGTREGREAGSYTHSGEPYGRTTRVNFLNTFTVLDSAPRS